MKRLRIGVAGCGVMGLRHLQSAADVPLTEPVAAADLDAGRLREAAEKFGLARTYTSGDELVRDGQIDAVVLAFPTAGRTELALKALAAGKHVLLEKPVAMNSGEVRRMMAVRGDRVVACCSCRYRFYPHTQAAAEVVASGALGTLRLLRARSLDACGPRPETPRPDWRLKKALNGGGYLVNWGCYDLDYLMTLTGWSLRPETVLAQTWPVPQVFASHVAPGSDAETYYAALVRCAGGTVISLERGEYMPSAGDNAWQIIGDRGSLRLHMTPHKGKQVIHDRATEAGGVSSTVVWQGDEGWGDCRNEPMRDFAEAALHGRRPATDLERSLILQQMTDAVYASAESGDAVRMDSLGADR